jgi:FkbM family methyltransferase
VKPSELLKAVVRTVVPRPARNWLRSPYRSAEWLWDAAAFSFGAGKTLQISPGWSVICHPRAYRIAYRDQINDPQQHEEFQSFLSHCSSEMFLFDIGAHFGIFSIAAARFGGRTIAVDPSPIATRMIQTQVDLNGYADRIRIVRAALSDSDRSMSLVSTGVFSDGYFQVARGHPNRDLTDTPAMTIDHMTLRFGAPTHIKIDVEGHEAAVLRGAVGTLSKVPPILFLELHNEMILSDQGNPASALDELERVGYETFALNGERIDRKAILEKPIIRVVARKSFRHSGE